MTDDDTVLVERLRGKAAWLDPEMDLIEEWEASDAADRIEAQAAEIERLREALLSCPLIARYETAEKFRERQDDWLATTYRAAIEAKEHLK
jgi:hypothetical protein